MNRNFYAWNFYCVRILFTFKNSKDTSDVTIQKYLYNFRQCYRGGITNTFLNPPRGEGRTCLPPWTRGKPILSPLQHPPWKVHGSVENELSTTALLPQRVSRPKNRGQSLAFKSSWKNATHCVACAAFRPQIFTHTWINLHKERMQQLLIMKNSCCWEPAVSPGLVRAVTSSWWRGWFAPHCRLWWPVSLATMRRFSSGSFHLLRYRYRSLTDAKCWLIFTIVTFPWAEVFHGRNFKSLIKQKTCVSLDLDPNSHNILGPGTCWCQWFKTLGV